MPRQPAATSTLSSSKVSTLPTALWALLPKTNLARPAVKCVESGVELSHREVQDTSLSFAGRLTRDLGYAAGDKLGLVLGGNCVESVIAQLGAAAAGVTVVTAAKPEDNVLEGCRGIVVSTNVLGERPPQGLLQGEKHPPIVAHDDYGVGSASVALFWQSVVDCRPLDCSLVATDPGIPFAVYGGAKATERHATQGQICTMAKEFNLEVNFSQQERVALAVPVDSPFGFSCGVMAALSEGGTVVLPSAVPHDVRKLVSAMHEEAATALLCDTTVLSIVKASKDDTLSLLSDTFRIGVVKIGSGRAFDLEKNKPERVLFGVPLRTIGRPLPISNRCS